MVMRTLGRVDVVEDYNESERGGIAARRDEVG